jgi:hypothetical protein
MRPARKVDINRHLWADCINYILWQTDAAMQQPDTDSHVSYATVFRMHERRPSLGNGYLNGYFRYTRIAGDETNVFLRNGFLSNTRDTEI